MEIVVQKPNKPRALQGWLAKRFKLRHARDSRITRIAAGSVALFGTMSMAAAVLGMPTGMGIAIDLFIFLTANAALMWIATLVSTIILSLMYVPLPRQLIAASLYVGIQTYLILYFAELGILMSAVMAVLFVCAGILAGILLGLLLRSSIRRFGKLLLALLAAIVLSVPLSMGNWMGSAALPSGGLAFDPSPNPSQPGDYSFHTFAYGSGKDKHRAIFGEAADLISPAADASGYITKWSGLKTRFWGFDQHALPLNGRVWMPEGEGPFPLALIVHGNHLMEYFSDGGYSYLGELLASRGIIAISIDENFLNYSVWSGIPDNDMKMRAWIMLKHLEQIGKWNEETGSLFSNRVDLNKVALIGHSRGGQAAAMAADASRWFNSDPVLEGIGDISIQSVVAIAPTDTVVDRKQAELTDINYLTLQGARDADVNNFYGDRQYNRVAFQEKSDLFKAALYIGDANHSQFNSDWGTMDERLPGGLFLNKNGMLRQEEQQQISKLYISAFLEATLLNNMESKALFQDYRLGMAWLPDTVYVSRYEESGFVELVRYEYKSPLVEDSKIIGMSQRDDEDVRDQGTGASGAKGIELIWDEAGAEYELELNPAGDEGLVQMDEASLVFSLANLESIEPAGDAAAETLSDGGADADKTAEETPPVPVVEIALETQEGEVLTLELNEVMPVVEPINPSYTLWDSLEKRMKNEKYNQLAEPIYQTFVLPMDWFEPVDRVQASSVAVTPQEISRIIFRFNNGPGKVMLDDIGFMQKGDFHD